MAPSFLSMTRLVYQICWPPLRLKMFSQAPFYTEHKVENQLASLLEGLAHQKGLPKSRSNAFSYLQR